MARVTPKYLRDKAERVSVGIFGPDFPGRIYCQHSDSGWHVYQKVGPGAQALGECLTPGECQSFLDGLAVSCILTRTFDQ